MKEGIEPTAQARCEAVLREMLTARGIPVQTIREHPSMIAGEPAYWDVDATLVVFFCTMQKLNIERIKFYIARLDALDRSHAIIVHSHVLTPSTKRLLEHLDRFTIEFFTQQELQYNLTRHALYRPHRRLPQDEAEVVSRHYAPAHLPVLLKDDPVARFFRFQRGDLIEIQRRYGPFYRVVK